MIPHCLWEKKVPNPYPAWKTVHDLGLIYYLFLITPTRALYSCHNEPNTVP